MNILKLIKKDHDEVKAMLTTISNKRDDQLLKTLAKEVYAHAEAEEECFYDPLRKKLKPLKPAFDTAHDEHDGVMNMLDKLQKIKEENLWAQMYDIIKKCLEAHMKLEEENIFDLANENFKPEELEEMGKEMQASKEKFLAEKSS